MIILVSLNMIYFHLIVTENITIKYILVVCYLKTIMLFKYDIDIYIFFYLKVVKWKRTDLFLMQYKLI